MRRSKTVLLASVISLLAVLATPASGRADEPDVPLALAVAATLDTIGFVVGGAMVATSPSSGSGDAQRSFGWLGIQAGYTLSPLLSHGVVDEWGRGALFAVVPAAALAATAAMYRTRTDSVDYSSLGDQRIVWSFFSAGLVASVVSAIDLLFADGRRHPGALALRPGIAPGAAWLDLGGTL